MLSVDIIDKIKIKLKLNSLSVNLSRDIACLVHPISFPEGYSEADLLNYLRGFYLQGSSTSELRNYLDQDFKRFVYTLNLLPAQQGNLFEIGGNPYFTSLLIKKFTNYNMYLSNYFGPSFDREATQIMVNDQTKEDIQFDFINHNIEEEDIPFEQKFDVVLFCEVIEHLTVDPLAALLRIKRSLKDQGHLILTTPNVNRLANVAKMIKGMNIYDPYSGYGPYGRHNREYNKHELALLLEHLGFEIEVMFSSDVHFNEAASIMDYKELLPLVEHRKFDLGQYIFIRAKNVKEAKECKPNWLYRSYPEGDICVDC